MLDYRYYAYFDDICLHSLGSLRVRNIPILAGEGYKFKRELDLESKGGVDGKPSLRINFSFDEG